MAADSSEKRDQSGPDEWRKGTRESGGRGPYVPEKEAAEYLGVSGSQMEKWRARGSGPRFVRIGRRGVRYALRDLDDFMMGRADLPAERSTFKPIYEVGQRVVEEALRQRQVKAVNENDGDVQ
jgi:predicted DNA-binding transcriptional regulator AlpA